MDRATTTTTTTTTVNNEDRNVWTNKMDTTWINEEFHVVKTKMWNQTVGRVDDFQGASELLINVCVCTLYIVQKADELTTTTTTYSIQHFVKLKHSPK